MANHKSALKRIKQNEKQRVQNRWHRGRMRTAISNFRTALEGDDAAAAKAMLDGAVKQIGITRTHGVIHKNNASRTISRLTVAYNRAFNAPA